jgi:ERCC4-related helicase
MNTSIKDNRNRGKAGEYLKSKIEPGSKLSFVSAYFTIYAYEHLKQELESIASLNFLFGEPSFINSLDPNKAKAKSFLVDNNHIKLKEQLEQKTVAKECAEWIKNKVSIKSIKNADLLHGKMYHIDTENRESALIGSSNFTVSGLGFNEHSNIELNLEVNDKRDTADLKEWFNEVWNNDELTEDVKGKVLEYLEQLYIDNTPEFVYYKTLYHIFHNFIQQEADKPFIDERLRFFDTQIWNTLFDFQKGGAKAAINKLRSYNGCIIADSVGLGKTYTALAVIKYFELKNERVLVLCPKRLRNNWTVYLSENNSDTNPMLKDRFNYTVLSHTDLSREAGEVGNIHLEDINWGNYDLVVIDESHNFRNNTKGKKDEDGSIIKKSRYEKLMDDVIKTGIKTKILLLSATPVNNQLKDLRNQISFMTGENYNAFGENLDITDYGETLKAAQTVFSSWAKNKKERKVKDLLNELDSSFFKLLDALTIARSRKHIKKYYDIEKVGSFPVREKPVSLYAEIDRSDEFMSYDKLNKEISEYSLSLFNPSKYILDEFKDKYKDKKVIQFEQATRENYLIGMMKVNFMKRIESSIHSFEISMARTYEKIISLEEKIKDFKKYNNDTEYEIENDFMEDDEDTNDALQVGSKRKFHLKHLDIDSWLKDLKNDRDQIHTLYLAAKEVTPERDAKLNKLKDIILNKINNPVNYTGGKANIKVLIFTAFADTAVYLYENLKNWAVKELGLNLALVTGGSSENKTTYGKNDYDEILTNFSPLAKKRKSVSNQEIDILIATDCISEGQNLQDCDCVINYDIHWNPVRIIQRFGRIDRIGSKNSKIRMINFWPTPNLDNYINLKNRVEARMALVDLTATAEENLLDDGLKDLIEDDLKYRNKQLERLKDEILDLDDFEDNISLTDFTLDDFRMDLLNYIEANKEKLEQAPFGIYSVVPRDSGDQSLSPGVIFCLKQKGLSKEIEKVNPVQPYFLAYVGDDGNIIYTFVHTKQVLQLYQTLCIDKNKVYSELVKLFNSETNQGKNMVKYDNLLEKAVSGILHTYTIKTVNILNSRTGKLPPQKEQPSDADSFELVTWLVIK